MQVEQVSETYSYDIAGEFAGAIGAMALPAKARVAVAVSGGADSMALALLLARWARSTGAVVHALTVDHRLRDAAAEEAGQVERWMKAAEIPHTTLRWDAGAGYRERAASAQSAAREARYGLMLRWCSENGFTHLFLAHHADDQAETVLLRLSRGSGVDGLGAMAPLTQRAGVYLARPLLGIPKARLTAFCEEVGQPWIDDPSNQDQTYARVRLRAAREVLSREGLSNDRLLATAEHMRRARAALDHYVARLLHEACVWDRFGVGRVDCAALIAAPAEVGLRALASILKTASGQVYRPRFERLERLYQSLRDGSWHDASLHGALLQRQTSVLTVSREPSQIGDEQTFASDGQTIWDGRFYVEVAGLPPGRRVLVRRLSRAHLASMDNPPEVPLLVRESLPAFFESGGLIAIPAINFIRPDLTTLPGVTFRTAFICPRIDQIPADDAEL